MSSCKTANEIVAKKVIFKNTIRTDSVKSFRVIWLVGSATLTN